MNFVNEVFLFVGLIFWSSFNVLAQDDRRVDSLKTLYYSDRNHDLSILSTISDLENSPDSILKYAELLLLASEGNSEMLHYGNLNKGYALGLMGDLDQALGAFFKSLDFAIQMNSKDGIGKAYIAIADLYSEHDNRVNAARYYDLGIKELRGTEDSVSLATSLLNAGDEYLNVGKLDSALGYTKEAQVIFRNVEIVHYQAYCLGNLGKIFAAKGDNRLAEENMGKALTILSDYEDYYAISDYLTSFSDIYSEKGDDRLALSYALRSLDLAKQHGLKEQISDASLKLSELYEDAGNPDESLIYYKQHVAYRDSVNNIESVRQMADLRTESEVARKQSEVDLLNQKRKNQQNLTNAMLVILGLGTILLLTLYWYYRSISREKRRSEKLLLNILPAETAEELKEHGKVKAKEFDSVSVLFTDFKGFTTVSSKLSPEELVASVDFYFSGFDEIIGKYGLEKIKTLGDAYMCAGGLPVVSDDHAKKMVLAAFEIADFVNKSNNGQMENQNPFEIRIGINTGPVVAGVVGSRKFAYDIWGDTVNIASRMESNSEPGKVNVSKNTYEIIKDDFECTYRGEIAVKNKGMMKMYFVQSENKS